MSIQVTRLGCSSSVGSTVSSTLEKVRGAAHDQDKGFLTSSLTWFFFGPTLIVSCTGLSPIQGEVIYQYRFSQQDSMEMEKNTSLTGYSSKYVLQALTVLWRILPLLSANENNGNKDKIDMFISYVPEWMEHKLLEEKEIMFRGQIILLNHRIILSPILKNT